MHQHIMSINTDLCLTMSDLNASHKQGDRSRLEMTLMSPAK